VGNRRPRRRRLDGIVSDDVDREPTFEDLDERVFREYARYLAGDRGFKQNTVQTYYRYISAWCGWCVNEGYLEAHYAQRASAMAPLPEDDGRKPGDQQAWTSEQRHALTRYVDMQARDAIEMYTTIPEDTDPLDRQRARYEALKAARDRALVFVLAYTAVRVGELLRDRMTHAGVASAGRTSRSTTGVWTSTGRNSSGTPPVFPTR